LLKNSKTNENKLKKIIRNNIILSKGPVDRIISKNNIAYNKTGNAVMTKGGTGDILAGLCAGFLAQTKDTFKSASMAAYLTGAVADKLYKKMGRTYTAADIVDNIHTVFT